MSRNHSAEFYRGAVAALERMNRVSTLDSPSKVVLLAFIDHYRALLAEAEAREASRLTKAQWIEWYGGQAVLDREGFDVVPCVDCKDSICHGWKVERRAEASAPTAAEVKAQIIAEYIDDNGMKCDCCQHVMIDVTASKPGEKQHCIAGDPEGEGSGCAWGWSETAEQKQLALEKAAEVIEALRDCVALLDNRRRGFDQTISIGDLRRQVIDRADSAIADWEAARK